MKSFFERGFILIILILCPVQGFAFLQAPQQQLKVEFHWAETTRGKGLTEAIKPEHGGKIYLHREIIIANKDILNAVAVKHPDDIDQYQIELTFTQQAAERMKKESQLHIGKLMAILINGKVIAAPLVLTALYDKADITGTITREQAEKITGALNRTSLTKKH